MSFDKEAQDIESILLELKRSIQETHELVTPVLEPSSYRERDQLERNKGLLTGSGEADP